MFCFAEIRSPLFAAFTAARLLHTRKRTQMPMFETVKRQVESHSLLKKGVRELHYLFTDPPGTEAYLAA